MIEIEDVEKVLNGLARKWCPEDQLPTAFNHEHKRGKLVSMEAQIGAVSVYARDTYAGTAAVIMSANGLQRQDRLEEATRETEHAD